MSVTRLTSVEDLPPANARLAAVVAEATGTRVETIADAARKARRYFSRRQIGEMTYLAKAEKDLHNPTLMRMIDLDRAQRAHRDISASAEKLDLKTDRERLIFGMLSGMAFNLILIAVLVISVLVWRGLV